MPGEGLTGGMIPMMFILTTVVNGILYALVAIGIYALVAKPN
jgi:hypothetical protein